MSIREKEAKSLISMLNNSKLNNNEVLSTSESYIRRSLMTKVKKIEAYEKLLIFHIDFTKQDKITIDTSIEKDAFCKECLFVLARPLTDIEDKKIDDLIESILSACFRLSLYGHSHLIFLFQYNNEIKNKFQDAFNDCFISDGNALVDILLTKEPKNKALEILREYEMKDSECPFSYLGPCNPDMFFGRVDLIKEILLSAQNGYAITGGRRIGKTSLLIKLKSEVEKNRYPIKPYYPLYIDCSIFSTFRELNAEIARILLPNYYYKKGRNYSFYLKEIFARAKGLKVKRLLLLLDEIDHLVKMADSNNLYDNFFDELRTSVNNGDIRLVISGYRRVSMMLNDINHPFYNLCEFKTLGFLNKKEVNDLITIPFKISGINIENKEIFISKIYDYTSGHPSFVQFKAKKLFQKRKKILEPQDIEELISDRYLIDYILDNFIMNTTPFERLICIIMLSDKTFSSNHVHNKTNLLLNQHNKKINDLDQEISKSIKHLTMNKIIVPVQDNFTFLNQVMVDVINNNYNSEEKINLLINEV